MKFSTSALLGVLATSASMASAFAPLQHSPRLASSSSSTVVLHQSSATTETETSDDTSSSIPKRKKHERMRMMKSEQFHRKGFKEVRDSVDAVMKSQFKSELVEDFKKNNYVIERDGVKVYLAKVRNTKCNGSLWVLFW